MGQVITAIIAIAKAIPTIRGWLEQLTNAWTEYKLSQYREDFNLKENQMHALYKSIERAQNDNERIALSITLHDLSNKL